MINISFISSPDLNALVLTLKLAAITSATLLVIGLPISWWLSQLNGWLRHFMVSVIALPLVLPPTVLGFYLLLLFSPDWLGAYTAYFGMEQNTLAFSFTGLVIGSVVYSLPFFVQPAYSAFSGINQHTLDAVKLLEPRRLIRFFRVILPQAKNGVITGMILSFAHTLGEFGVVLMIGGNIPSQTKVVSIAIYEHVENLEYANAHALSLLLVIIAVLIIICISVLSRQKRQQTR